MYQTMVLKIIGSIGTGFSLGLGDCYIFIILILMTNIHDSPIPQKQYRMKHNKIINQDFQKEKPIYVQFLGADMPSLR